MQFESIADSGVNFLFGSRWLISLPLCDRSYGFVRFDDSTCAANAIASLNGYVIGSKQLKVSISKPPERERKTNLYISGLPTDWTQQHLEQLVTRFGQVNEVRVLTDPITRKGKGVGFARFDTIPAAAQCIQDLNGQTVDGGMSVSTRLEQLKSELAQAACAASISFRV